MDILIYIKKNMRRLLCKTTWGYRLYYKRDHHVTGPHGVPDAPWHNAVMTSQSQVEGCLAQVHKLGLPPVRESSKNWDTLAALDLILKTTKPQSRILDAGGERYSMLLPWLALYGYKNLKARNLVFSKNKVKQGPIEYSYGDITATEFADNEFDGITCLSVIEHGVELSAYFEEMGRILKTGGSLITSADYFEDPVDTRGQIAYGVPIHIFNKGEIEDAIKLAGEYGLQLISPIDLHSEEKVVHWKPYNLYYTYVVFTLRKHS